MEITINIDNINEYSNSKFDDVYKIKWQAGKLRDIFDNFPNLQELICCNNQITSIESLSNCVNLQILNCWNNQIISLEPLINCINLQILECSTIQITSLEPLSNCVNLQEIYCCGNQIMSLDPLINCINLQILNCDDNQITSLESLSNCVNLQTLICSHNLITSLDPLSNCINLQELYCYSNQITSLAPLVYLRQLTIIYYSENPLEVQNPQVQRFLDRINTNRNSSIYHDRQNVHDTEIQRTICDSIRYLLSDPKPIFSIDDIINSDLDIKTKEAIVGYCQDETIHSVHLITFQELLSYVWNRIIKSNHQSELKKILEEQIADAECMCFTGRFNRTLSVLIGFYDDIKVNISDKSRIAAIILNCRDKIMPYDSLTHKEMAQRELIEAGYSVAEIGPWIDAIDDE